MRVQQTQAGGDGFISLCLSAGSPSLLRPATSPRGPGVSKCCPGGCDQKVGQVVGWGAQGHSPQGGSSELCKPPLHKMLEQGNFKIRTHSFLFF